MKRYTAALLFTIGALAICADLPAADPGPEVSMQVHYGSPTAADHADVAAMPSLAVRAAESKSLTPTAATSNEPLNKNRTVGVGSDADAVVYAFEPERWPASKQLALQCAGLALLGIVALRRLRTSTHRSASPPLLMLRT